MEDNRQKQIEEVRKTTRPDFKRPEIDRYFDDFDTLYGKLEKNAAFADSVEKIDAEYGQWAAKSADLLKLLNADQKYKFSKYNVKLAIQWHDKIRSIPAK